MVTADTTIDEVAVGHRRVGVIEVENGQLRSVTFGFWPRRPSKWGVRLWGRWRHAHRAGDRCRLYYYQPRRFPQFLALTYVESNKGTSYATFRRAVTALDEIAALKGVDAILCDASNPRISDRLLARWGWTPHAPMSGRRNFIKRLR